MKMRKIIIAALLLFSIGILLAGCSKAPEEKTTVEKKPIVQDVTKGTSFQDHSEGKYGPPGSGGYGPPKEMEQVKEAVEQALEEKKPLIQDVTEGTSFQDHREGKYGPPGSGGYGPPKEMEQVKEAAEEIAK
jgi:PBP1b-binding outer membrane lipoprotein LpoB